MTEPTKENEVKEKPYPLELAAALDANADLDAAEGGNPAVCKLERDAAALLRAQHAAIERLTEDLAFVERWANHHGAKPHTTPKEALSVIQHYPPIKAITRSYKDGVVPDTFDPYAAIERKDALLRKALEAMQGLYGGWRCESVCKDIEKELAK